MTYSLLSDSYTGGLLTTVIPKVEELNANIKAFNNSRIRDSERANFVQPINYFGLSEIPGVIDTLSKFQTAIEKLLNE